MRSSRSQINYAHALVSIRPTTGPVAWETSVPNVIKLLPQHTKTTLNTPPEFHFDEVLTGSENKPIYNAVAKSHVLAAMEGYNAVIFAYGQTASGKTFTLVRIQCFLPLRKYSVLNHYIVWKRRAAWYHSSSDERRIRPYSTHTYT